MNSEKLFADFIANTRFSDIPQKVISVIKSIVLNIAGTTTAGANREGCRAVVELVKEWGGKKEATILIHGSKVPAHNAAFANSYMARALDIDDAMFPGMHVGASTVPAAFAAAELAGSCSGPEFLSALAIGHETAARFNSVTEHIGFDHTGVGSIMGAAAAAAKILQLTPAQALDTLALAFNKCSGSFQSNIDGSLAVRIIQGFAAQGGILCAQLAKLGINGPKNFIEGIYGYLHLFGRDKYTVTDLTGKLGQNYIFYTNVLFKKHPSCACTEGSTDAILYLMQEHGFSRDNISRIDITVSPIAFRLVGHPFEIGETPTVNAQFNVRYCVASAILRGGSSLKYFEEDKIKDPQIDNILKIINVGQNSSLENKPELLLKTHMKVTLKTGQVYEQSYDEPRGSPGNPLSDAEFQANFRDYISSGTTPLPQNKVEKIISLVTGLEKMENVCHLIPLITV